MQFSRTIGDGLKIDLHKKSLSESLEVIEECIQFDLFFKRQKSIGFHCSSASIDLLEMLLHRLNLVSLSAQIKHNWFASENKIKEKLNFDFPDKQKIIQILMEIEEKRNLLCYGKPQPEKIMRDDIFLLKELKEIIKKHGVDDG